MAEICQVCNKKIRFPDIEYVREGLIMHSLCSKTFEADPEKYGGIGKKFYKEEERIELKEKSKGMILTDIDLPFGRVFWVTVQFFLAGLIIAIPFWIILMVIISN